MKLSAAVFTITLLAAPACAENWAPEVNAALVAAVEVPAVAAQANAAPRDGSNYSGAEELLIKEFAITAISMDIPETEVMRQGRYYTNAFCFEHALRLALGDLLENYSNPASPLARLLGEMGAPAKPSKAELKKARQKMLDLLNTPSSQISLVRPYALNQPLNGETVEENWIFFLRLDGSPYWSVVDRAGGKPVYTYGPVI
ncbi:MAG: hypothetical protein A2081_01820 [Elusimicrobia bacterium GWC2_61_19]|nr:MAG: hypothetical protein A2081_01820 [Elusimicrobia bacterium GWC2_61_19]